MKQEMDLDSILKFMLKVDKLKKIKRAGWVISKVKDPEHVADHSFSTAAVSYLLAKKMGLDAEKCAIMGLFHDINEVLTGDIATRADERMQKLTNKVKKRLEEKNTKKLISMLSGKQKDALMGILEEYLSQKTREAKLVYQADKLDYIIQIILYSKKIKSNERVIEFFKTAGDRIDIPEVEYLYEKIKEAVYKERGIRL
jgi:putative hydrolase of HD superfamily